MIKAHIADPINTSEPTTQETVAPSPESDIPAPEVDTQAPEETVLGTFSLIYKALNEAGKVCNELPNSTEELVKALDAIPQPLMDKLVQHITAAFSGLQSFKCNGISFMPSDDGKMILSVSHMTFNDKVLPYVAPYDLDGIRMVQAQLEACINKMAAPSIITLN
jgi:hypothetical protein